MKQSFVLFLMILLSMGVSHAQVIDEPYMTWGEFVSSYLDAEVDDENAVQTEIDREWLEYVAQNPLQINLVDREELRELPFLNGAQIDSLLSYREHNHGFMSLGELQLVSGMDYYTRCRLSLFLRCDSAYASTLRTGEIAKGWRLLRECLTKGKHELESRVDVPLYKRKGYYKPKHPTTTNYYVGNALHHIVRYRYQNGRDAMYGLTLEKDAGEPICKQGFYPYDYWSGYIYIRPKQVKWQLLAGDFQVYAANGLIYGKGGFMLRNAAATGAWHTQTFKPHTSSDEANFFRGIAFSVRMKRGWNLSAFASYRCLDARLNALGDTAITLQQTGLHRTLTEISMRRCLGSLTCGTSVGLKKKRWGIELNECINVYDKPLFPVERLYNRYYFRGQVANVTSVSYCINSKHAVANGECAIDHKGNMAIVQNLLYKLNYLSHISLQTRCFSPKFVSLYGRPLQQGSRVANEVGAMLSTYLLLNRTIEVSGYADVFMHPKPTYNAALSHSKGVVISVQTLYLVSNAWNLLLRYQLRAKQYTLTATEGKTLEYRTTHKVRIASEWKQAKFCINVQLDASAYATQTGQRQFGCMLSSRVTWQPSHNYNLKCSLSAFFTDDYETRLYAYQPQLLRTMNMPMFCYHGVSETMLFNWIIKSNMVLSMRISSIKYLNRKSISSRLDEISSSWKNDLSIQIRWSI